MATEASVAPKWVRNLFYLAGAIGLIVLLPHYFLEARVGRDFPPPITHPEYFYGFVGVAVAWQIVFLIIGSDPVRYRPLMLAAVVEKFTFGIAAVALCQVARAPVEVAVAGGLDMTFGVLFAMAWYRLGGQTPRS